MTTASTQLPLSTNPLLNALLWNGWRWDFGSGPKALTYFLANDGGLEWTPQELAAYVAALENWSSVVDLDFVLAANREEATWIENLATSDQMLYLAGSSGVYAFHDTPEDAQSGYNQLIDLEHSAAFADGQAAGFYSRQAIGQFDGWTNAQLLDGGFFQFVMVHELGHGLGFKHTHEAYGPAPTFPGVTNGRSLQLGTNQQNHQLWTVMSYNTDYGFDDQGKVVLRIGNPSAVSLEFGYAKGPMAYDIAAIQFLYGANPSTALGDTIYELPTENIIGTGWTCIWDAGGTDMLRYSGNGIAMLDLTAATLDGSTTGGGVLSHAAFVGGGFTIANGVVIENAMGGSGDDLISGNAASNTLFGNSGNDTLFGAAANDVLFGMDGNDELEGGSADFGGYNQLWGGVDNDTVSYARTNDIVYADLSATGGFINSGSGFILTDSFNSIENISGGSNADTLVGDASTNTLSGRAGNDVLFGLGGDDILVGGASNAGYNQLWGGEGSDTASYEVQSNSVYADVANYCAYIDSGSGYVLTDTYNSIENLSGGQASDVLVGDGLANAIAGGGGADQLYGRGGADRFVFSAFADSTIGNGYDTIADFEVGIDKVDFTALQSSAAHLQIFYGDGAVSVYLAQAAGAFEPLTDISISLVNADTLSFADFLF